MRNGNKNSLLTLYKHVFNDENAFIDVIFNDFSFNKNAFFVKEKGEILSCAFFRNKKIRIANTCYSFPFLFGLCTNENHRKKGLARKVLTKIFIDLFKKRYAFLGLFPYPAPKEFYYNFGFLDFTFSVPYLVKNLTLEKTEIKEILDYTLLKDFIKKELKKHDVYQELLDSDFIKKNAEINAFSGKIYGFYHNSALYGYVVLDGEFCEESLFNLDYLKGKKIEENALNFLSEKQVFLPALSNEKSSLSAVLIKPLNAKILTKLFSYKIDNSKNLSFTLLLLDNYLKNQKLKVVIKNKKVKVKRYFGKNFTYQTTLTKYADYFINHKNKKTAFSYGFLDKY